MKLEAAKLPWTKIAIVGLGIAVTALVVMTLLMAKANRQLSAIQSQLNGSTVQAQSEQTRFKNLQQEFETVSKNSQEKDIELQQQRDAVYILSGLIGPGRLLMPAPSSPGLPHTFKVSQGGSFTVTTGCGGGPVYMHTDKFTITKINTDQQTRTWYIEMKRTDSFEVSTYDEETDTNKLVSSTTTQRNFIITSDDPINTIGSGTDRLVPTLVTPDAVYFVRAQYSC